MDDAAELDRLDKFIRSNYPDVTKGRIVDRAINIMRQQDVELGRKDMEAERYE